jgi:antitoxin (DNA-binding transcriptional repressor) of toxin-antitoxin stability system
VSGVIAFATPSPGEGRLELDLWLRDFQTEVPPPERGAFGPIDIPSARAVGAIEITPRRLRLESARIDGVDLHLEAEGIVERPLQPSSLAQLSLEARNVALDEARHALGWFPHEEREDLAALLEPVKSGRLVTLTSRGAATLAGWRELFAGRTLTLPMGFAGEAEFAEVHVGVGATNQIEGLNGRVAWSGDRIDIPSARAVGAIEITPRRLRLESVRIDGVELHLEAEGIVERPLQPSSLAQLSLEARNVALDEARHALGWFPHDEREDLAALLEPVKSGRLVTLTSRGAATLAGWRELFAGRTPTRPRGFAGEAEFAEVHVEVGATNQLEGLNGRVAWSGDRIDIQDARAGLNGRPLPKLDLTIENVSHLFAARADLEPVASQAQPLLGLRPLWEVLKRDARVEPEEGTPAPMPTTVHLEIDVLAHPMFLWPIRAVNAFIVARDRGVHIVTDEGTWGGIPIRGDVDWLFEPEEALSVRLAAAPRPTADAGTDTAAAGSEDREAQPAGSSRSADIEAGEADGGWARGRFSVGAVTGPRWRQTRAVGRFTGVGGGVEIADVQVDLAPSGRLLASARLELTEPDAVPCRFSLTVTEGDVEMLSEALGLPAGWATGRINLSAAFEGSLRPPLSPFAELSGGITLSATDGVLQQRLSPIVAVTLASGALNPFAGRDEIRYARVETVLEFSDGLMRTRSFSLDGPDARVLVEGEVDLAHPPHVVRAEVALFLFRQLDNALGKIPLLGTLLLGSNEGMMAAYFELSGPWAEPEAKLIPMRSLVTGPGGAVLESSAKLLEMPGLLLKGVQVMLGGDDAAAEDGIGDTGDEAMHPPPPPAHPEPDPREAPTSMPSGS